MNISKTIEGDTLTLSLDGRLDTATAPELQPVLLGALGDAKHVTVDMRKLVYVSSAGLRTLLMGQKAAKTNGATMMLKNVSAAIMEVFDITGFTSILTIE